VARTCAAADAAHEQRVDRCRALRSGLIPPQKSEFGARERAWLNEGRAEQERPCVETQPVATVALAMQACRLGGDRATPRAPPRNGDPGRSVGLAAPAWCSPGSDVVDHFHLIAQPILGICSAGPCPVTAT
jgi:hypothetical protein